jgi:tRNA (guanine37-N1)-methyltransferase
MTTFHIITIFPEAIRFYFETSILGRAQKNKLIKVKFYNPRDFTVDKHHRVDDKPFGGGPGMVMMVEPILKAVSSILNSKHEARNSKQIKNSKTKIILLNPAGKQFTQKIAMSLARFKDIIIICGKYEGIDERIKKIVSDFGFRISDLSIGPYVLGGGELPAAIIVDAVSRHIKGVLGKEESLEENREGTGVPVYTRPEIVTYKNKKYAVPKVLLSGHHEKIKQWRKNIS